VRFSEVNACMREPGAEIEKYVIYGGKFLHMGGNLDLVVSQSEVHLDCH